MKYNPAIRFLALLLAVVSLAAAGLGAILYSWNRNLDENGDPAAQWADQQLTKYVNEQMQLVADRFAQIYYGKSITEKSFLSFIDSASWVDHSELSALMPNGDLKAPYFSWQAPQNYSYLVRIPGSVGSKTQGSLTHAAGSKSWSNESMTGTYYTIISIMEMEPNEHVVARSGEQRMVRREMSGISVTLELTETACKQLLEQFTPAPPVLVGFLTRISHILPWLTAGALALFLLFMAYLLWTSGYNRKKVLALRGLNRLPLDAYLLTAVLIAQGCIRLLMQFLFAFQQSGNVFLLFFVPISLSVTAAVLPVCWLMALSAQIKRERLGWLRRCLLTRLILWLAGVLPKVLRRLGTYAMELFGMMPILAQWLLTGAGITAVLFLGIGCYYNSRNYPVLILCLAAVVLVIAFGGWSFGKLARGVKQMRQGELSQKISTHLLPPGFRDCGEDINALADAAMTAAQEQMKSERMKTELITNVSHDIKTPLTSIISYAQLLQEPHTPEQEREYLDVMTRQSLRMKKLVEDLVDMSKATTGNVEVDLTRLDAVEAMNQALGEFTDRFDTAGLRLVYEPPHEPLTVLADSRLVWRVLSNLLGNVVKYAMEGTRVYVNLTAQDGHTLIAIKNISREPLRISADELMERFVRGDASRNTEGSGLGLNIVKSLMELQNGSFRLSVDGDLFKVELTFPSV